ncbi:Integral membrane protein [Venustampulla echinocandica]|uniref:Integral membrane protein n=1 Tax=Venustampulla echinocandica TaxID=2656787 RepID=A0A370U0B9_9HELO|nr:Integral membrane protein [Venustampulla echinocandica]RDL41219.1 Integral membrane protein [Venustampulla echinocandica]
MSGLAHRDNGLPPQQDVGPILMWISGILMVLTVISTALRIFVRCKNRIFGWDDATMLLCVACAATRLGFEIKQAQHGNGKHRVYLSDQNYMMINKYGWYGQIFLFASVAFLKVSICLLILRIKNTKPLKILVYTVMAGVLITNFGVVIILLAECRPAGFWRGSSAKCWPTNIRIYCIYATIGYSVLTDLFLSLLPPFVVWKVRIPLRTKLSVSGLMGLGLLATGFGIARAASLGIQTSDLSWAYCIAGIWSNLELFLGIIAANVALSHSIYVYFFGDKSKCPDNSQYSSPYHFPHSRSGANHGKLRGDNFEVVPTVIEAGNRRPSESRSSNSDIPMVAGIRKKTEFWMSEEDAVLRGASAKANGN